MTVLEIRNVAKTRKAWRCDGCHRRFPAGSPKERQRIVGDDGPYSIQWCPTCQGISDGLFALGAERDNWHEDVLESMQSEFGTWESADAKFGTVTPSNE
jgi:hypothetical protein